MSSTDQSALVRERLIVQQENYVFEQALKRGQISQAQYDEAMVYQRARLKDQQGAPPGSKPTPETTAYIRSQQFYQGIGRPEYDGVYAVPNVPPGYDVVDVKKVSETKISGPGGSRSEAKLEFTLRPKAQPPQGKPAAPNLDPLTSRSFGNLAGAQQLKKDPLGYAAPKVITIVATVAGLGAPAIAAKGAALGLGITQGFVGVTQGRLLTPEEAAQAAAGGAAFSAVGTAAFQVTGVGEMIGLKGVLARAGLSSGLISGASYIASGGKPEAAVYGAALGAGLSVGGEVAGYVYPRYIKPGLERVYGAIRPNAKLADMYNRVVVQAGPETAPVGSRSWIESIKAKVSPTRSLYERVNPRPLTETPKTAPGSTGGADTGQAFQPGGSSQWVVQKVVPKKIGVTKTPMSKTLAKVDFKAMTGVVFTAPKIDLAEKTKARAMSTKQAAKQTADVAKIGRQQVNMNLATTQAARNPFTAFPGKPFYRRAMRASDYDDLVIMSYPSASPLAAPADLSKVALMEGAGAALLNRQAQAIGQGLIQRGGQVQRFGQIVIPSLAPLSIQDQGQGLDVAQIQDQAQELTTDLTTDAADLSKGLSRYYNFDVGFNFNALGGRGAPKFGGVGFYQRAYPVVTGEQVLKDILGQTTKKKRGRKKRR